MANSQFHYPSVGEVDNRIDKHEAVCAERWKAILSRMARIEKIMMWIGGSLISGMAVVIWQLLSKSIH